MRELNTVDLFCGQVKQIGNSVPVMTAAAMCEADFREAS